LAKLRVEHQAVKDELAAEAFAAASADQAFRMDKSTQAKGRRLATRRRALIAPRGSQLDRLKIGAIIVVKADRLRARAQGFEDVVVQT